ncbi:MAG: pyridoxamine kinase [Lachnospiraceae bacterium]
MSYNRVLTIQDVSCLGQCSGTVALPIISACGQECCIIPSAVLSTHTAGFTNFTVTNLAEEIPGIRKHWEKEGLQFDCIYTGYLGSVEHIDYVKDMFESRIRKGGLIVVDPAMADHGSLYYGFDMEYVENMKILCSMADIVLPNITEACFLTGMEYKTKYDESYVRALIEKLQKLGAKSVALTSVSYEKGRTGVTVSRDGNYSYYEHEYLCTEEKPSGWHGTGDIYSSAFVGAVLCGKTYEQAAVIAADYVMDCIKATIDTPEHWYGVRFETQIGRLAEMVK